VQWLLQITFGLLSKREPSKFQVRLKSSRRLHCLLCKGCRNQVAAGQKILWNCYLIHRNYRGKVSEPVFTRARLASAGISSHRVSVRPSVCQKSVFYSTETPKRTITQTTPHDTPETLVFWRRKSRLKRKSYISFRLVPKSVTLNDLERRNGRYMALFQRIPVASEAHCVKVHVRYLISWWVLVITTLIPQTSQQWSAPLLWMFVPPVLYLTTSVLFYVTLPNFWWGKNPYNCYTRPSNNDSAHSQTTN